MKNRKIIKNNINWSSAVRLEFYLLSDNKSIKGKTLSSSWDLFLFFSYLQLKLYFIFLLWLDLLYLFHFLTRIRFIILLLRLCLLSLLVIGYFLVKYFSTIYRWVCNAIITHWIINKIWEFLTHSAEFIVLVILRTFYLLIRRCRRF
jgi:hypothetical protein